MQSEYQQMYNEINSKFYYKSTSRVHREIFIITPFILLFLLVLLVFLCKDFFKSALNIFLITIAFSFIALILFYSLIVYSIRKSDEFSWKKVWRIISAIELYRKFMHQQDTELLIQILKEHNINTRPKVLEAIRHYQCLIPRKIGGYSYILSLVAICLSVIGIFFQESVLNSQFNLLILLFLLVCILLVGTLAYILNKDVFRYIGTDALNERIEMALSEIYMKMLIR